MQLPLKLPWELALEAVTQKQPPSQRLSAKCQGPSAKGQRPSAKGQVPKKPAASSERLLLFYLNRPAIRLQPYFRPTLADRPFGGGGVATIVLGHAEVGAVDLSADAFCIQLEGGGCGHINLDASMEVGNIDGAQRSLGMQLNLAIAVFNLDVSGHIVQAD